jgi:hypothetical protein
VSGNNGFIYVSNEHWQKSFSVYRRSDNTLAGYAQINNSFEQRIALMSEDGFKVVHYGFPELRIININQQGQPSIGNVASASTTFFGTAQRLVVSPLFNLFIPELVGNIYNDNLELKGTLDGPQFATFNDFAFSADGTKIFAVSASTNEIQIFSSDDFQLLDSIQLNYQPFTIDADGNSIVMTGFVFNGFSVRVIVEKIDL